MLSRLVVLLLLAKGAWAGCDCTPLDQPPSPYTAAQWPLFYIQNPIDEHGDPCAHNCTYTMDSGTSTLGVGNFKVVNWDQDDNLNSISVFNLDANGKQDSVTLVNGMVYANRENKDFASLSQKVQVVLTMVKPVNILASLERTQLGTTPAPAVTTPIPIPTTTYHGEYLKDPALISNDVIFMVDAGYNNGKSFDTAKFNESKDLAAKIVSVFTNVYNGSADGAPATGSRLGMSILSQIASGSIIQPWLETADTVAALLRGLTLVSASTVYVNSISPLLNNASNSPFSIANADAYSKQNSRPQAQRMLIVVSSSVPTDIGPMSSLQSQFLALDVHPVFIAYKFDPTPLSNLDPLRKSGWAVYNASDNSNATVEDFVNSYLITANNVCPLNYTSLAVDCGTFVYPSNYKGANNLEFGWVNTNQTARYCNFHKTQGTIKTSTLVERCFKVFYDLEVEKDYLRFFDSNNNEIVSFTGSDVSGSTFKATGDVVFKFETNESQVFGGFRITYGATC